MTSRWIRRRSHSRQMKSGRTTIVRASWALYDFEPEKTRKRYRHPCPECGSEIVSVHMTNGGWAHFEGGKGLGRIKHPCLHRGLGLPSGRDELTPDMFEDADKKA